MNVLLRPAAALALCGLGAAMAHPVPDALRGLLDGSDGGVLGEVVAKEVRVFAAPDGGELFFTTVRVHGTDLATGAKETVLVTFPGGFISETRGAHSSTAPPADATRVGRRVLMFHRHVEDIAAGFSGDVLVSGSGGLFQWFTSRKGEVIVQGGGPGSGIERNLRVADLRADVRRRLEREDEGR